MTTRDRLNLAVLMAEDSTYYDDLFAHVVQWDGVLYLEDGLHRALRAALQQRTVMHARVLVLTADSTRKIGNSLDRVGAAKVTSF